MTVAARGECYVSKTNDLHHVIDADNLALLFANLDADQAHEKADGLNAGREDPA